MSDNVVMRVRSKSFTWPNLPPRPKLGPGEKYHPRPHGGDDKAETPPWLHPKQSLEEWESPTWRNPADTGEDDWSHQGDVPTDPPQWYIDEHEKKRTWPFTDVAHRPPGFTPKQRLLRNMGDWYEDQIKDEWETQPSAGKPLGPGLEGDIDGRDEPAAKSEAEREQPFWDHLSPWYKDRARKIAGDEADV